MVFASTLAESLEYIGNREYREGDNIRDIDWRATARLNTPIVREYREEYFLRVGVVLDTACPRFPGQVGAPLRAAGAGRKFRARRFPGRSRLGLHGAAGLHRRPVCRRPQSVPSHGGRSLAYLDQILDILARVEHSGEEPFAVLEPEIVESLAQITTIACIFMDWDATRQAFAQRLQREGASVKIIVARDQECTLNPADADMPGALR